MWLSEAKVWPHHQILRCSLYQYSMLATDTIRRAPQQGRGLLRFDECLGLKREASTQLQTDSLLESQDGPGWTLDKVSHLAYLKGVPWHHPNIEGHPQQTDQGE